MTSEYTFSDNDSISSQMYTTAHRLEYKNDLRDPTTRGTVDFLGKYQIVLPSAIRRLASSVDAAPLGTDFLPGEYDVVCGRGKGSYNRPGNRHFREIVRAHVAEYLSSKSKLDKSLILNRIIEQVRAQNGGTALFVKERAKDGAWFEIGDDQAREKVGHAIREAVGTIDSTAATDAERQIHQAQAFHSKQTGLLVHQQALFESMVVSHEKPMARETLSFHAAKQQQQRRASTVSPV
jgi:hypothetical protein